MQKAQRLEEIFSKLPDAKFNQNDDRGFNQIQSERYCTCLVHLEIVRSTANLPKRWYFAGFKFASSVGSGRLLFNQTVYNH